MQIEQMQIGKIKPFEKNPRRNDDSVDAVANSIKAFGFRAPIIVDRDLVIIAGHTRWKAAKKLQLKTVPVIIAEDMTEEQAQIDIDALTEQEAKIMLRNILKETPTDAIHDKKPAASRDHPTMKPVTLLARLIYNSSHKGDTVLDPFGGSGSTLMACEQLHRRCIMMELDPIYCDVIVKRWEALTGNKAEREGIA